VAKIFGPTPTSPANGSVTLPSGVHRDGDYLSVAKQFAIAAYPRGLRFWRERWWSLHEGTLWRLVEDLDFRAKIYVFVADQRFRRGNKFIPLPTSKTTIDNVIDALKAVAELAPDKIFRGIALIDGKIDPVTRAVTEFAAEDFVTWTLPFSSKDLVNQTPAAWLEFLAHGSSSDDVQLLKEWFGYCLIGENRLQKTLWLYGPPGCGKSVICKILISILAPERVAVRTDETLKSRYNDDLIDKRLIYFSDYRNDAGATQQALKFLLTVGGDDPILIEGKYKTPFTARVDAKILFTSNEMPMFRDTTAASLRRLMIIHRHAWAGTTDPNLYIKLEAEIRGIFAWALDGARDLIVRGRFDEALLDPKLRHYTARATNATFAFIQDAILFAPQSSVTKLEIFDAWRRYAEERGQFQRFNYESFVVSFIQSVKLEHPSIKADSDTIYGIALEARYGGSFGG
jgi:putative DNA primase/helicase